MSKNSVSVLVEDLRELLAGGRPSSLMSNIYQETAKLDARLLQVTNIINYTQSHIVRRPVGAQAIC